MSNSKVSLLTSTDRARLQIQLIPGISGFVFAEMVFEQRKRRHQWDFASAIALDQLREFLAG